MKRDAVSSRPVTEDTFLPELEQEEARIDRLLSAAREEAARRIREAETAADALLVRYRESAVAPTAERKRERIAAAREELDSIALAARVERELLEQQARSRIPEAVDAIVAYVLNEQGAR